VRRVVTPGRLLALGLILIVVVAGAYVVPSDEYIFLPDPAHPVAPLVKVRGGHEPATGGIYFVDVVVRKASILEKLFGGLHEGADLYPASAVNPPGTTDKERRRIDLEDMANSQQIAALVAERAAGKNVVFTQVGARVEAVGAGFPADGKLQPDDVIVDVDGKRTRTPNAVISFVAKHRVGDTVAFTVDRDGGGIVERIKTTADPRRKKHPFIGVQLVPAVHIIRLPVPVHIDAGGVGGPSAGLAFALDILRQLGRDVVHGRKIAATGELFPDGTVGPIGGVKQKTIGARRTGVDAFLVPAGENARDARKVAHGLRIIPVETFPQALHALATLR
jgi:PDZ domain-containing protein